MLSGLSRGADGDYAHYVDSSQLERDLTKLGPAYCTMY